MAATSTSTVSATSAWTAQTGITALTVSRTPSSSTPITASCPLTGAAGATAVRHKALPHRPTHCPRRLPTHCRLTHLLKATKSGYCESYPRPYPVGAATTTKMARKVIAKGRTAEPLLKACLRGCSCRISNGAKSCVMKCVVEMRASAPSVT